MAPISILFGLLLIGLGLIGYYSPETLGKTGPEGNSPTALIPAAVGGIILICGLVVIATPHLRKHMMHLAAVIGLIGAVGGVMPVRRTKMDFEMASTVSGLLMILLCGLFVVICVRSFVRARIAKSEGLPENPRVE